jgi:hypothetical protein
VNRGKGCEADAKTAALQMTQCVTQLFDYALSDAFGERPVADLRGFTQAGMIGS